MVNVLLIYTALIPSVRFCALEMLTCLEQKNKINLKHKKSCKVSEDDLNECDVLVLVRCAEYYEVEIAKKCKRAGKKLIYVLDDDLFCVPEEIECHAFYASKIVRNNIKTIMNLCDVLWSPNPNLIKKYGHLFEKSVLIEEPCLGEILQKNIVNKPVRIGFAGTATHKSFVNEFLKDILCELKKNHKKNIEIYFFGVKPSFIDEVSGTYIPYFSNYEKYCEKMKELTLDIGLAPLEKSEFASCKYFNKYIEYSTFGICGIYSKEEPYTFAIKDKVNGLLVDNDKDEWIQALNLLIEDETLLKTIVENAQRELKENYSVESIADKIFDESVFVHCKNEQIIKYRGDSFVVAKIKSYMQIYGIKTPFVLIKKATEKLLNL